MSKLSERLKELRDEKNLTQEQLGSLVGTSKQYISQLESGKKENPKNTIIASLADALNVDLDYLVGRSDTKNHLDLQGIYDAGYKKGIEALNIGRVPIYNCISCGSGLWIDEQPEDYVGIPSYMQLPNASYFANPAEGDSMEPLIQSGDCLVFERKDQVESGRVGSFSLNGQYYCKRFRTYPDGSAWLYSDNQSYQPILIKPEDDFRVLGELKLKVSKI